MMHCIVILFCINLSVDSLTQESPVPKKSYTGQIVINGIFGVSFGIGAGIFHIMGNKSYDEYKKSTTMKSALDNWDKTKLYDNLRNVCIAGTAIFVFRTVYYQLKNVRSSSATSFSPVIDFQYADNGKWIIGLKKGL